MSESSHSTSTNDNENNSIKKLKALYDSADQFSREVSEFRSEISIPAYNELRYAGYHLKDAINDEGFISDKEQIRRAISHCERAMYEAAEAGIIKALSIINTFKEDYKDLVVSDVLKNYSDILLQARKAKSVLAKGRGDDKTHPERSSLYMNTFRELKDFCEILESNRDDLNAKYRKERSESITSLTRIAFTILGTVATIVFGVFGVYRLISQP